MDAPLATAHILRFSISGSLRYNRRKWFPLISLKVCRSLFWQKSFLIWQKPKSRLRVANLSSIFQTSACRRQRLTPDKSAIL